MIQTVNQRQEETQGTSLDLTRLFRAVWNAKWFIIGAALFFGVLMAAKTAYQVKPKYKSSFGVYVLNKTSGQEVTSVTTADISASSQLAGSYATTMKSNQYFIEQVLEAAGLTEKYSYSQIRSAIATEASSGSQNVTVTVTMAKAEDCLRIAHAMASMTPVILPELVQGSSVRITSNPLHSASVISADVKGSAKKGLLYGFVAALALVILFDIFDRRVKSEREIKGLFDGRIGVLVPTIKDGNGILQDGSETPAAEAYRLLRTEIGAALKETDGRLVGVTSVEKGAGKSVTAVNLAASFGQIGRKTMLVDGSMRAPRIAELTGTEAKADICAVLRDGAALVDAVAHCGGADGGFDVLACGAISEDPTKLLASPNMEKLLAELTGTYDVVVIDLPHADGCADAAILAEKLDVCLVVVRNGKTDFRRLRGTLERLGTAGAKRTGYVFNDAGTVRI